MSARCDLSDLPVEQCACRLHAPAEPRRQTPSDGTVLARIEAQYPGRCGGCDSRFDVGDRIVLVLGGGWQHEECAE